MTVGFPVFGVARGWLAFCLFDMPGLDQVSKMQDLTPLPLSGGAYLQARYSCKTSGCHGTGFGG